MWANKTIDGIITILAWIVLPLQIISTFVLGILVNLTFGLLLFPMSLIWTVLFLGPLLGLSWLWRKLPFLRIPLAIIGIPIAILGSVYTAMMPSMGEIESRVIKLLLCETWPFSLECSAFLSGKRPFRNGEYSSFEQVLLRLARKDPAIHQYLSNQVEAQPVIS